MSKIKTKYLFTIYSPSGELITENGTINDLKKLNLEKSVYSAFNKKKSVLSFPYREKNRKVINH